MEKPKLIEEYDSLILKITKIDKEKDILKTKKNLETINVHEPLLSLHVYVISFGLFFLTMLIYAAMGSTVSDSKNLTMITTAVSAIIFLIFFSSESNHELKMRNICVPLFSFTFGVNVVFCILLFIAFLIDLLLKKNHDYKVKMSNSDKEKLKNLENELTNLESKKLIMINEVKEDEESLIYLKETNSYESLKKTVLRLLESEYPNIDLISFHLENKNKNKIENI